MPSPPTGNGQYYKERDIIAIYWTVLVLKDSATCWNVFGLLSHDLMTTSSTTDPYYYTGLPSFGEFLDYYLKE
jgi:hypothetical protein